MVKGARAESSRVREPRRTSAVLGFMVMRLVAECLLLQCAKVKVKSLSHVRLLATPWTAAYQAPPSMAFSRQEYWSGVPLPSVMHCLAEVYSREKDSGG